MITICPACSQPAPRKQLIFLGHNVTRGHHTERLSPQEFKLLRAYFRAYPNFLSREDAIIALYGYDDGPDCPDRTISVILCTLRAKATRLHARFETRNKIGTRLVLDEAPR